jgi:hypothetical protein
VIFVHVAIIGAFTYFYKQKRKQWRKAGGMMMNTPSLPTGDWGFGRFGVRASSLGPNPLTASSSFIGPGNPPPPFSAYAGGSEQVLYRSIYDMPVAGPVSTPQRQMSGSVPCLAGGEAAGDVFRRTPSTSNLIGNEFGGVGLGSPFSLMMNRGASCLELNDPKHQ